MSFINVVADMVGFAIKSTKLKFHHLLLVAQLPSQSPDLKNTDENITFL